jgi:replicative DNA helicase
MSKVSLDMFSLPIHKLIFEAMVYLYMNQQPINLITVSKELLKSKSIHRQDALSESSKVYSMFSFSEKQEVPDAINYLIAESIRHEHIDFAKKVEEISTSEDYEPQKVIDLMQGHILDNKFKSITNKKEMNNQDLLDELDKKMSEAATNSGINGIRTGYKRFDKITSGMHPTNFIIVAARPAMGKTQFALGLMKNASISNNYKGLFISCEMDDVQVMKRIISVDSGISGYSIKRGILTPSERGRYERSRRRIISSNLKIVAGSFTISDVLSLIYKMKHSEGLDYVVIDYIQKITSPGTQNRTNEVGDVSRKLKDMANDLKIPVIALAQLSRAVEHRVDKKPMLSDLRESGDIEQDADIVTFLYRNSYYMNPEERDASIIADDGYLIVAKHRDGELEDIHLKFDSRIPAWRNPDDTDDEYVDNYVQTQLKPNIDF